MRFLVWRSPPPIKQTDLLYFFMQLTTLLGAGISLMKCLDIIHRANGKKNFKALIQTIRIDLESGRALHQCLQRHSRYFDAFSCQLVRMGEQSGTLELMLKRITHYKENNLALRKDLLQALFYPCLVLISALGTTLLLLLFVVPQFASLFEHFPNKIPLPTQVLLSLASGLQASLKGLGVLGLGLLAGIYHARKSLRLSDYGLRLILSVPPLKRLLIKIALAKFSRNLATLLQAGLPLSEALIMLAGLSPLTQFNQAILQARSGILAGKRFYTTLTQNHLFPSLLIQMTKTGEEAGSLDSMLEKFADISEAELDRTLNKLRLLLEPLIITILGVLIGGVVIALYLPIFRLGTAI